MKKLFAFALTLGLALGMTSCGDGSGDYEAFTFEGTVVGLDPNHEYTLVAYETINGENVYEVQIWSGNNGKADFSIVLPSYISIYDTELYTTYFPLFYNPSWAPISDDETLVSEICFELYDGPTLVELEYSLHDPDKDVQGWLIYSDRAAHLIGNNLPSTNEYVFNVQLKQGWNVIYETLDYSNENTRTEVATTVVRGLELRDANPS